MNELTLESFFLKDYADMRNRNEALEKENAELKKEIEESENENGFEDLRMPIKLIYVDTTISKYSLFEGSYSPLKDATVEELRELIAKNYSELEEILEGLDVSSYGTKALKIHERTFPFTLRFKTYKGVKIFAYDPDYDNDQLIIFLDKIAAVDEWVTADFKEEAIRIAIDNFIEVVERRIETLAP